jgi:glutamate dehydrogenase
LYKVLNLDERGITKFQTGGPDGDLGSNEILQSLDKTTAIVDGSGVAYDPNGLARTELERLARSRQTISHFNRNSLGEGAFLVLVGDENVSLPDGSQWRTGLQLRNSFVFTEYARADLFVPCGGRPATVNDANIDKLLVNGASPWSMVVEGANLFFTAEARRRLEVLGVHVIKDSSANKGGVTSSSLEVLASLAFRPRDHDRLLTRSEESAELPEFYLQYVDEIIKRIEDNCRDEFRCIWQATSQSEERRSKVEVSKVLSNEITNLTDHIASAEMSPELVSEVLSQAIPGLIIDRLGVDAVVENVPSAYLKATVAYWLASKYVYETGINNLNGFAFHKFMLRFSGSMVCDPATSIDFSDSPRRQSVLSPRTASAWSLE